jgi:hypothetical protein
MLWHTEELSAALYCKTISARRFVDWEIGITERKNAVFWDVTPCGSCKN